MIRLIVAEAVHPPAAVCATEEGRLLGRCIVGQAPALLWLLLRLPLPGGAADALSPAAPPHGNVVGLVGVVVVVGVITTVANEFEHGHRILAAIA